jgi:hypothetical protein
MLSRERNNALVKVRAYRHDQDDEALPAPADELDAARWLAEIETHASLIEHAEDRLKQIDGELNATAISLSRKRRNPSGTILGRVFELRSTHAGKGRERLLPITVCATPGSESP